MFTTQRPQLNSILRPFSRRQSQRGQSIVVALLVLLLLGLAGALFVTIVARNLINAGHSNRVQTADQYAAAGITYADSQLSSSMDGADWRPPLQFQLAVPPTEARELARYNAAVAALPQVNVNDPDAEYLQAGYARYNTGAGRYLVRVTYDPVNVSGLSVPPGKYLKIESIGREGNIDPTDPTTYTNNRSSDKTQATLVAYKPIGITDYARFETNPDKRSDIANLGVVSQYNDSYADGQIVTSGVYDFNAQGSAGPNGTTVPTLKPYPVITTYGAADAYMVNAGVTQPNPNAGGGTLPNGFTAVPGGGSIHSNMPLRFFGKNVIYLNSGGANAPLFQDTAEIGGDLLLDSYDPNVNLDNTAITGKTPTTYQAASLILNPAALSPAAGTSTPLADYVQPSNSGVFDTHSGLIRDGSMQNDAAGLPRSITRLEPPLMDAQDNASQMPRYRAIAMNSAPRPNLMLNGSAYTPPAGTNPSLYGYGKAIYVNNPNDIQQDSAAISGGSTLTDEWLHRTAANSTNTNKGGWNGLFYNPPGVTIVLGQLLPATPANGTVAAVPAAYGIRLTRSNGDSFIGPDGTANAGPEMNVRYSDLDTDATGKASDNDIVIYAEGNVRVRGILSPTEPTGSGSATQVVPRHITIVTGGTAYIEGNLLKGDPDSSISVLAHDYVCVNTTQFLAGSNAEDRTDGGQNPDLPDSGNTLTLDAAHSLLQEFNFGLTGTAKPATYPSPLALYIAAGPGGGGSTTGGDGSTTADINIFDPTGASVFPMPQPPPPIIQVFTGQIHLTYDLSTLVTQPTSTNSLLQASETDLFQLSVSKDPGTENGANTSQDVALERVAVLPMDIRIEAVLYAQTGSFFVIPGDWFNTNESDNLSTYLSSFGPTNSDGTLVSPDGTRPDLSGAAPGSPAFISGSRFPMYGQPIDLKITIDGSVSEAHPADIAAQTAWMQHWGWIPQYHGSLVVSSQGYGGTPTTAETAGHTLAGQPAIGLQIIYDPQAGYPYSPSLSAGAAAYYLRSDAYGRPLPFTPKLPVSTGLLYSGQSGEAPLLQ